MRKILRSSGSDLFDGQFLALEGFGVADVVQLSPALLQLLGELDVAVLALLYPGSFDLLLHEGWRHLGQDELGRDGEGEARVLEGREGDEDADIDAHVYLLLVEERDWLVGQIVGEQLGAANPNLFS